MLRDKIHCAVCGSISNRATEVDETILCERHFNMLLNAGLLFEYEADTDWHYGQTGTPGLDRNKDRQSSCEDAREIVELLK